MLDNHLNLACPHACSSTNKSLSRGWIAYRLIPAGDVTHFMGSRRRQPPQRCAASSLIPGLYRPEHMVWLTRKILTEVANYLNTKEGTP